MSARAAARLLALTGFVICAQRSAAAPDATTLIAGLARTAPASIAFAEARFSSLLREPLIVSGELSYQGPANLERRVMQPYRETTAIRGDSVSVEREGEDVRTFALQRAPELKGFFGAFGSLLAGDAPALMKAFAVAASGDDADWKLELTPLDSRARRRLQAIVIQGSGTEPRCFATLDTQGGGSVMLVGAAAAVPVPAAASLDGLLAQCGTE
jgi:hypothetical protein